MNETKDDLNELQALLDRSVVAAGSFLRESLQMPEHSLKAGQLIRHFNRVMTVAVATTTAKGEPRVSPVGAILHRGHFHLPTVSSSVRAQHIARRPGISLTYFEGNDLAVIVHGQAQIVSSGSTVFEELDAILKSEAGSGVREWGDGIYIRIHADRIYTFARYIERFPH